jgi:hypothetical protein
MCRKTSNRLEDVRGLSVPMNRPTRSRRQCPRGPGDEERLGLDPSKLMFVVLGTARRAGAVTAGARHATRGCPPSSASRKQSQPARPLRPWLRCASPAATPSRSMPATFSVPGAALALLLAPGDGSEQRSPRRIRGAPTPFGHRTCAPRSEAGPRQAGRSPDLAHDCTHRWKRPPRWRAMAASSAMAAGCLLVVCVHHRDDRRVVVTASRNDRVLRRRSRSNGREGGDATAAGERLDVFRPLVLDRTGQRRAAGRGLEPSAIPRYGMLSSLGAAACEHDLRRVGADEGLPHRRAASSERGLGRWPKWCTLDGCRPDAAHP